MSYSAFLTGMLAIAKDYGIKIRRCHNDKESGRFYARFSDGMTITARPTSPKVTIRYGSGHQLMATMKGSVLCA